MVFWGLWAPNKWMVLRGCQKTQNARVGIPSLRQSHFRGVRKIAAGAAGCFVYLIYLLEGNFEDVTLHPVLAISVGGSTWLGQGLLYHVGRTVDECGFRKVYRMAVNFIGAPSGSHCFYENLCPPKI